MSNDKLRRFVKLTKQKRQAEKIVKDLKTELENISDEIVEYMSSEGMDKITIDDMTVYTQETFSVTTNEQTRTALVEVIVKRAQGGSAEFIGLEHMLNLNSRSLTAHFKERLREAIIEDPSVQMEDVFPPEIKDMLIAFAKVKPMARASGK